MERERNYGIDLLRIVLMFMVCLQHIIKYSGGVGVSPAETVEYKIVFFIYIFCLCAVNGFAIISGYMATDTPQKYHKIVDMWFQAVFYSLILTVLLSMVKVSPSMGVKDYIKCAMPVTFNKFWYFTAYFGLFFITPVLNKFLFMLDERKARICFMITGVLFTVIGVPTDAFRTNWGYSVLWLMVMYCVGVFAKIGKIFDTKRTRTLVILLGLSVVTAWGFSVFLNINIFLDYISPIMLVNGLLMVLIFSRIKIKGTMVAKVSPLVFGVYLFHQNQVIVKYLIESISFERRGSVFVVTIVVFVVGLCVEFVRSHIAKMMRIPLLSKKIVNWIECFLQKSSILLK